MMTSSSRIGIFLIEEHCVSDVSAIHAVSENWQPFINKQLMCGYPSSIHVKSTFDFFS